MNRQFPEEKMQMVKNNVAIHTNFQNGKNKIIDITLYQSVW